MNEKKPEAKPIPTTPASEATDIVRIDAGRLDLLDPDVVNEEAMRALERRAAFLKKGVRFALAQASPSQFVVHRAEGGETESVYPMGSGAAAMLRFFGLHWAMPEEIPGGGGYRPGPKLWRAETREVPRENGDKAVYVWVESGLWRGDQLVALCEGKRLVTGTGYVKDAVQAEQNAFQNLMSRSVRLVLGLAGKDRAWYKEMGLDLSTARVADFQDRKTQATSNPDEAVIKWGNAKGSKVSELTDKDLAFYLERYAKDAADPDKKKFKPELMLAALKAEQERRASKPAEDAEAKEALDKLLVEVQEEMDAAKVKPEAAKAHLAKLTTVAAAQKSLDYYRGKRAAREATTAAQEPGSDG